MSLLSCAEARAALPLLLTFPPPIDNATRLSILGSEHIFSVFGEHSEAATSMRLATATAATAAAAAAEASHELFSGTQKGWRRTLNSVLQERTLRILVLGTSPTAGCNGAPKTCGHHCNKCDVSASWGRHLHDILRTFFARASGSLGGIRVMTSIHFKNAVDLSFFAKCTSAFLAGLPAEPHVVLLEGAANLGGDKMAHDEALAALRRTVPNARPVIAAWPRLRSVSSLLNHSRALKQSAPVSSRYPEHAERDMMLIRRSAERGGADFINVAHVLASLALGDSLEDSADVASTASASNGRPASTSADSKSEGWCLARSHQCHVEYVAARCQDTCTTSATSKCSRHQHLPPFHSIRPCSQMLAQLFALNGSDTIHPSRHGHVLFGALGAHLVARQLLGVACPSSVSAHAQDGAVPIAQDGAVPIARGGDELAQQGVVPIAQDGAPPIARGGDELAQQGVGAAVREETSTRADSGADGADEVCYPRADLVPRSALPKGWILRDESTVRSVTKLGFVSETPGGDPLVLGPIQLPPGAASAACLGVILSLGFLMSWRPEQGALMVTCEGCPCTRIKGMYAPHMFPFPFIETSTYAQSHANDLHHRNVSVTYVTTFWAQWSHSTPCFVKVAHERSKWSHSRAQERSKVRIDSLYVRRAERTTITFARGEAYPKLPWPPKIINELMRNDSLRNGFQQTFKTSQPTQRSTQRSNTTLNTTLRTGQPPPDLESKTAAAFLAAARSRASPHKQWGDFAFECEREAFAAGTIRRISVG